MTVFQVLFIIALIIPIGAVLIYFLSDMFKDLKVIRQQPDPVETMPNEYEEEERPKKKKTSRKAKKSSRRSDAASSPRRTKERVYREPERPVQRKPYYDPPKVSSPGYPSDPYSDYRRPDFDSYIRHANERDRMNKEIFESGNSGKPDPRKRKASGKKRRKKRTGR